MSNARGRALSVLILLALSAGTARADRLPRVAVVVLMTVNIEDERATAIADQLGEVLREQLAADVVTGREVSRRLPVGGVAESCPAQPECVRELGARLQADRLLFLVVVAVGERVQIDATWADAASGDSVAREALQLEPGGPAAAAVFADAAPRLFPELAERAVTPAPVEVTPPPAPEVRLLEPAPPEPAPVEPGRRISPGTWIAGGISAATLAGGIGFALAARSRHDQLSSTCPQTCTQDDIDGLRTRTWAADGLLAASLVAAGVGAWLYLRSDEERPALVPVTSDEAVGLGIVGHF